MEEVVEEQMEGAPERHLAAAAAAHFSFLLIYLVGDVLVVATSHLRTAAGTGGRSGLPA